MHVLILPSWYFQYGSNEIPGRMFHQLAKMLRRQGIDARVFYAAISSRGPWRKQIRYEIENEVPTWRHDQWFFPKANAWLFQWWIREYENALKQYIHKKGKPDVLHAQSYMAAAACAGLQHSFPIPYIYTERLSSLMTGSFPPFHHSLLRQAASSASVVTCVSPGLASCLKSISGLQSEVIPNFYDEQIFYPDSAVAKEDVFTWISVGEPAYTKGLDLLLEAFATLKQKYPGRKMKLMLVDRIPERKKLIQQAQALNIDAHITWTGLISQEQLAVNFRKSHVFLSASRVETFGKAIIEAMACGMPTVCTKTDGARYIFADADPSSGIGELAEINNAISLSLAMETILLRFSEYHPARIHQYVHERFSSDKVIPHWMDLYNKTNT